MKLSKKKFEKFQFLVHLHTLSYSDPEYGLSSYEIIKSMRKLLKLEANDPR